jgi:homoserine dehydrogenase
MKTLNIGLFGCGTVGSGVYRILSEKQRTIAAESGATLAVTKVCVLHPEKERAVALPKGVVTTDHEAILDDPSIDIVVELIGGEIEALGIITRALVGGKKVVTANKAVVSKYLPLLRNLEDLHGGRLLYGAAVCGSVPVLKIIDETLLADRIVSLRGVVNGSTNFILSRLADGMDWADALLLAREQGFLETDPRADLFGIDAAQKLSILAYHAFGRHVHPDRITTTGITDVSAAEIAEARAAGCTVKLVAEAYLDGDRLNLSVLPKRIALDDSLASVRDEVNIVEVQCEGIGTQRFTGKGAGSAPTANAVVSDLLDIVAHRRYRRRPIPFPAGPLASTLSTAATYAVA